MHYFGTFDDSALAPHDVYAGRGEGYRQAPLIGRSTGSVAHRAEPSRSSIPAACWRRTSTRSKRASTSSRARPSSPSGDAAVHLRAGDYGALKVGTLARLARSRYRARALAADAGAAAQAGGRRARHVLPPRTPACPLSAAAARRRPPRPAPSLGHFDAADVPPVHERQNVLKGLEGVFLKWLIDENVGAAHHRLLFIEYQPGVGIGLHDHTFEEGYFILSGEVEATMDGKVYRAGPGNVLWTGVGCVHAFRNVSAAPVRWLETFAPQPPKENAFRFMAEWETRARELEG